MQNKNKRAAGYHNVDLVTETIVLKFANAA